MDHKKLLIPDIYNKYIELRSSLSKSHNAFIDIISKANSGDKDAILVCQNLNDALLAKYMNNDLLKYLEETSNMPYSSYFLGRIYLDGIHVEKNYECALKYSQRSLDMGNLHAVNIIGNMYHHGIGVEKNREKAMEVYQKGFDQCDGKAIWNIAYEYNDGLLVKIDYKKAVELWEKSFKCGFVFSLVSLANAYYSGKGVEKNYQKAVEIYKTAIELKCSCAMIKLAYYYKYGVMVEKNYHKAMELYEMAINLGETDALDKLIILYENKNIKLDENKLNELYEKAIELKHTEAINNLASIYLNGELVEQNYEKTIYMYEQSVKLGDTYAMVQLANMYIGLQNKNLKESFSLFTQAADLGNTTAMLNIGLFYFIGRGHIEQNYTEAFRFYKKAYDLNDKSAACCLSEMCYYGRGTTKDINKAIEFFEIAKIQLNHHCTEHVGNMYRFGIDNFVEKNNLTAINLYKKTIEQAEPYQIDFISWISKSLISLYEEEELWLDLAKFYLETNKLAEFKKVLIDKILTNDFNTTQFRKMILDKKLNNQNLPTTVIMFKNYFKQNIDFINLHFDFAPDSSGYLKAKEHFYENKN